MLRLNRRPIARSRRLGCLLLWLAAAGRGSAFDDSPGASRAALVKLVPLPSGMVIDNRPPSGWDRLVIKSIPRLASGDLSTLPSSAKGTATLFRTVILAKTRGDSKTGFGLEKIGVGLCVPRQGQDVVVSPGVDPASIGVNLGTLDAIVLDQASRQLAKAHLVARSPTMAILDAPTRLAGSGVHREGLIRYAFLVNSQDAAITVALWPLDVDLKGRSPVDSVVVLPPSLVSDSPIDVSATTILGQIPVTWSFALAGLPTGRKLAVTADLGSLIARDPVVAADVVRLETRLKESISTGPRIDR